MMKGNYDDIIGLPHPTSATHPRMPVSNRAAQFLPFAALTGYEEAIEEAGRLTDVKIELDENEKRLLDEKLWLIQERIEARPRAAVTFFQPDNKKEGGAYVTAAGRIKKIDGYGRALVMEDGTKISLDEITGIELDEGGYCPEEV